jgi:hypothetical protein
MRTARIAACLITLTLAALPCLAADQVIYNGIDLWRTSGDGSTFANFANNPIPAGFFCHRSEPFTGRIAFRGMPVATSTPGALGLTDTIVQRLDDAVFNQQGIAFTRIQLRSLNFESLTPVKTACGLFNATVSLDGEQPITRMRIIRENAQGGRFQAPISVNVKISFTPVGRIGRPVGETLELRKEIRFPPLPNQRWVSLQPQGKGQIQGFLLVDTDGDREPDTFLPGTSNFGVGESRPTKDLCYTKLDCHEGDCMHCVCAY